jgi:hypothetical protein
VSAGTKTAASMSIAAVSGKWCSCSSWVSVSVGADGEGVEVVGEDPPGGPGAHPMLTLSLDRRIP